MGAIDADQFTQLLKSAANGDSRAADAVFLLAESELRKLARRWTSVRRSGQDIQTTMLIDDAFVSLVGPGLSFENRHHFYAFANRAIWDRYVESCRKTMAKKRNGATVGGELVEELPQKLELDPALVVAIDDALAKLQQIDGDAVQIVRWKMLGHSLEQIANELLPLSLSTIKRRWGYARAWLHRELSVDGAE